MRQAVTAQTIMALALAAVGLAGCHGERLLTEDHLGPPLPQVTATTRILGGSDPAVEVEAIVRNPTGKHILMPTSAVCPLYVRIFPDSSGQEQGAVGPSMECSIQRTTPLLDLAPGDSTRLSRTIPSDSLASYPRGTYGVNVAITIVSGVIGVWAGAIRLPLTSVP